MVLYIRVCVLILTIAIHTVILEDIKDLNLNELLQLAQDTSRIRIGDIPDDEISFTLFTQSLKKPVTLTNETTLDTNKPTKIIIHGWIANNRRSWYQSITEEFLKNGDYNVIQVDWEKPARSAYVSSAINTKLIGEKIGNFVCDINIPPESIHMVGHSLGAHIAGFASKQIYQIINRKVSRISGLDPAGPYFQEYIFNGDERLDKNDAHIVDVIHTDAGVYGISFPLGTFDIYVNSGRAPQPGCSYDLNVNSFGELLENSFCSHAMSTTYFIEWINYGEFRCRLCKSYGYYLVNLCPKTVYFKEGDINKNVTGICVTETHQEKPFLDHSNYSQY